MGGLLMGWGLGGRLVPGAGCRAFASRSPTYWECRAAPSTPPAAPPHSVPHLCATCYCCLQALLYVAFSTRFTGAADEKDVSTSRYRTSVCAVPIATQAPALVPVATEAAAQ